MRAEWERADKDSPAASPQTEELEKSRFWIRALLGIKKKKGNNERLKKTIHKTDDGN